MNRTHKVLYLSYDGMTDPLGQSQVLPYLKGLSDIGYEITLVSFEKKDRFDNLRAEIEKQTASKNINWQPLIYTKSPPVLSTVYDLMKLYFLCRKLHSVNHYTIIHCRSYITSLVGLWMKKKHNIKFVFDMRGFFADERVEGGIWNLKNPVFRWIYSFFKKKELQFFQQSDYTISLTNKGKEIINSSICRGMNVNIKVIPCCADLNHFDYNRYSSVDRNKMREHLGVKISEFVISYSGSIGSWYMLSEMLDFFKVLLEHKKNAIILFITNDEPENILSLVRFKNIDIGSVKIVSALYKQMPDYLLVSDASVFFIKPVFSKMASSPTKQGEIMGMGIPLICNNYVGDTGEIISSTETGFVVDEFNETSYLEVIKRIDFLLQISKKKIRDAGEKYYSLEEGIKKYAEVYKAVLSH